MHKAPPWAVGNGCIRKLVSDFQTRLSGDLFDNPIHQLGGLCDAPIPISFKIHCPHCDGAKQVCQIPLIAKTTWRQLSCAHCGKSITASKWKCVCSNVWHKCHLHRQLGFACRRPRRMGLTRHLMQKKKKLAPLGEDWMLQPPLHGHQRAHVFSDRSSSHKRPGPVQTQLRSQKRRRLAGFHGSDMHCTGGQPGVAQTSLVEAPRELSGLNYRVLELSLSQQSEQISQPSKYLKLHTEQRKSVPGPPSGHERPSMPQQLHQRLLTNQSNTSCSTNAVCHKNCIKMGWTTEQYCETCHG